MSNISPECDDGLPNLCGPKAEETIPSQDVLSSPAFLADSDIDFARVQAGCAIALHMHQPLIPAGGSDLRTAAIIGNLQFMLEHPEEPDAHNAGVFLWCYKRMGEFIPQLVSEGKSPRVMLDFSGCLLHGLRQMERQGIPQAAGAIEALRPLAQEPALRRCVEWLGTAWGHAVAPSTPPQDFRRHVQAWRRHFSALFGAEALVRVRGFSPPEMALPNHPDLAYEFVRTLRDCGYRWVLVQEHTVERVDDGGPIRRPHVPHRLIARNSSGQSASIIAIIKTQGSDTKLVGQMQPYYEAKGLGRVEIGGKAMPPLVTQIGDGENGGVMMNEFPSKFMEVMREASGTSGMSAVRPMLAGEYLEHLWAAGVGEEDLPTLQPAGQKRVWDRFVAGAGPGMLAERLEQLRREDGRFHMEGGSWTGDRSWVQGYEGVLGPMEKASDAFAEAERSGKLREDLPSSEPRCRSALYHLLLSQTSCFRYWGQGRWTDYGRELCRRVMAELNPGVDASV